MLAPSSPEVTSGETGLGAEEILPPRVAHRVRVGIRPPSPLCAWRTDDVWCARRHGCMRACGGSQWSERAGLHLTRLAATTKLLSRPHLAPGAFCMCAAIE